LKYLSASLTVGAFLLISVILSDFRKVSTFGFVGMLAGSILHYIIVHYICTMTVYSGNRVIYSVPLWVSISVFFVALVSIVLLKRTRKRI
jgi:hypothetical protein